MEHCCQLFEGCAMGPMLHRSTTRTEAIRQAIHHSQESLRSSRRAQSQSKDHRQWKTRTVRFRPSTGPQGAQIDSPVREEEAVAVAFRRHALLPLDDCPTLCSPPSASDALVHRCLQRNGSTGTANRGEASARRDSRPIRSAISISTSPRFEPRKASSTSSSPSTERRSSPSSSCMRRWRASPRGTSCAA